MINGVVDSAAVVVGGEKEECIGLMRWSTRKGVLICA